MQKSERSARADKASPAPASAPAPAMRPAPEHPPPLKRMEFVRSYGSTAYETATGLASSALSSAPTPLSNAANSAYAAVAPRVEPFALSAYSVVAPRATFLLESVDTRVRTHCTPKCTRPFSWPALLCRTRSHYHTLAYHAPHHARMYNVVKSQCDS
jgi:hypothetical protein